MKIEIYKDGKGEFLWRMVAKGRIIADSGEGYKKKAACERTLARMVIRIQDGDYKTSDLTDK